MSATAPLIAGYEAARVLIWQQGRGVTQAQFLGAASALAQRLPSTCTHILPLSDGRAGFMLSFAASLMVGKPLLLPSVGLASAIEALRLAHPGAVAVAETGSKLALEGDVLLDTEALFDTDTWQQPTSPEIPLHQLAVIAHTSGSSGPPRAESKSWAALRAGVAPFVTGLNIVATVPPQHMFGLEATVLLALVSGCAVDDGRPFYPADIVAALAAIPAPRLLVSTPIHLRAALAANLVLPELALVLSATAALSQSMAAAVEERFKAPLYEIYGCTEAGSLASRRTTQSEHWQLHRDLRLEVSAEGSWLHASYLPEPVLLSDELLLLDAEHFRLLGRNHETLKVAGKRIALGELNAALLTVPGVHDAVVFMPDSGDELERPAALVVAPGLSAATVLAALALAVDAVFLPRPLRLVASLPRNAVGKLPKAALLEALYRGSAPVAPASATPCGRHTRAPQRVVPADHPALPGHFAGNPLIPGVVLLDWAWRVAQPEIPAGTRLSGLSQAKFLQAVRAGDALRYEFSQKALALSFKVYAADQLAAQGSFTLGTS